MEVRTGDVVQTSRGNFFEVKPDGTYIDFSKSMHLESAEYDLKHGEITAVYRQVKEDEEND
ncbi:hypothetical protein [Oceanobacillus indicireducens]|uniref:Uncharacterized protein n=1 Tax=Oceanobacillus indicireducens TaxID=1004261 RepID=A0A917XYD7_9BACI|nr:hypothetical protein [Oceanobacillus indicireducens]GGN59486.1 hypothetical protein GCM10007971_22680 [Oceanobacillus indicireducens]